jgi:transcription-repair coupling factor (superfamily II helicase)
VKKEDFLTLYTTDTFFKNISHKIDNNQVTQINGLVGSIDSVLIASYFKESNKTQFVIVDDKEDASFLFNDIRQLLGKDSVYLFPSSYKKAYEYNSVENANVLMRSEVLSQLTEQKPIIIVAFPESIAEKVVSKQTFVASSLTIRKGEQLDVNFITELLVDQGFQKTDFVYEPGQFATRGGIVDIFSYSYDRPYRIELFGNEVENLRIFNPETQLTDSFTEKVVIIPQIETRASNEKREFIIDFILNKFTIWIKDVNFTKEKLDTNFETVSKVFNEITDKSGTAVVNKPEELFVSGNTFTSFIEKQNIVEFGRRFYYNNVPRIDYTSKPQPSFNKEFNLFIDDIEELRSKGFVIFICSESKRQLAQVRKIIEELNPTTEFDTVSASFREGFIDYETKTCCYTDHQLFEKYHSYQIKEKYSKSKALTVKELQSLQPGDFVTHIDYGVGRFAGMETITSNNKRQEVIRIIYRDNDLLFVNIHALHKIAKYSGKEGTPPVMSKLGSGEWEAKKSKVKKQVKDIAEELISLYAKRREVEGFKYSPDTYLQIELESSFMYNDTPDQRKATNAIKEDMEKQYPMDRLICGDVGFGKTEIAIRAAFKAVNDNMQVAVLVPTTILAMQHQKTFSKRLAKMPVNVDYINRFKSTKQINETLKKLEEGKIDILIGTHGILGKKVKFKNLGLLIIDEEQKFGVTAKEKIKNLKLNVDVLTLTATPIPRTLHFSLMGARDLSIIATAPKNRLPVSTEIVEFKEEVIRDAISYELQRGGQVFFVHNRVNDIESIGNIILRLVPDAKIAVAHGQMDGDKLEKAMMRFVEGEVDVLVSTNIIEAGLDIPNANTIMINQAHMFGLSDLHQMRGRVGRGEKKAFCYLLTQPKSLLTKDARKRLQTLEEFSDLGDGFKVAMKDLDIRGAGNLLGSEQSGFINDLGYEVYHKILDDAVKELKNSKFKELFKSEIKTDELERTDCQLEVDFDVLIPPTYITNISERLSLYNDIDHLKEDVELEKLKYSIVDRFGKLPKEVQNLFEIVKVRWMAEKVGFEKLVIKNNILKGYFVSSQQTAYYQSDKFGKIIDFIRKYPDKGQLKQVKEKLTFTKINITSINASKLLFEDLISHINQ